MSLYDVTVVNETYDVTLTNETIEVVSIAEQGPPGPPGSTEYITVKGGTGGVNAFQMVIITSSDTVQAANAAEPSHAGRVIGMAVEAITEGESGNVQIGGEITNPDWNLMPGQPYFLVSGGEISLNPSMSGFIQRVGVAKSLTKFLLNLSEPILIK